MTLEDWRRTRSPKLADELEALPDAGLAAEIASIGKKTSGEVPRAIAPLLARDDPRVTTALVKWFLAARWPSSGALPIWRLVLDKLVALRDRRAIVALESAVAKPPKFAGIGNTKTVLALVEKTLVSLRAACEKIPDEPFDASRFGGGAKQKKTDEVMAIVARVWASPDDDATRLVAADALLELGSPWGELIQLQMKPVPTAADLARAAGLIHRYGTLFGGPIADVARKETWRFERGFLVEVAPNRSQVSRPRWEEAVKAPHWATVRKVLYSPRNTPRWFIEALKENPAARNIQEVGWQKR